MKIEIKRLELTNFKCFRHKEFSFDSDVTTIKGRNGVGKTTIADAILWCLFGKNSAGKTTFDLKTHYPNGKPIPALDHSVEIVLQTNAIEDPKTVIEANIMHEIILKRTLKETWVKKRGSDEQVFKNNTTEYYINGESYTAKDYKKYISSLIPEDTFRAITNPAYFPSIEWQQQREFLVKMVAPPTPDEIAGADNELFELASQEADVLAYRKHLSYQIKQIKDKLDKIPVRLEEQNKALPERLDWDALQVEHTAVTQQLKDLDKQILAIKSGNGDDVRKAELRMQKENLLNEAYNIEERHRTTANASRAEHDNRIVEATRKFSSLVTTQREIESQLQSLETLKKRCQETINQCEKDAQVIREEWADNLSRTIQFHEEDSICPTCNQHLPMEQVAANRRKAEENLNADKARIKAELTELANKVKATRAEAEKTMADYDQKKAEAEKNLSDTKEQINTAFSEKARLEKESVESYEDLLAKDEEYQGLIRQIMDLQEEIQNSSVTSDDDKNRLLEIDIEKQKVESSLSALNYKIATRSQYDKIQGLIADIEKEQKDIVTQLSELERKEDVARRYQDRENTILEERINQYFSLVKWKMFRTVNNGGDSFDEPYCECYVDGVAYHDGLNQAAQLNAGLDIINTLSKHYNVSAPIVLDNSESIINILKTVGQQIRLQVSDTDLQII